MPAAIFMEDTNSLIEQRRAKLKSLEAKGIFPFANKFTPDRACHDARSGFESGTLPEGTPVAVAGRITAHREMGKSMFIDVRDQSGRIQIYAQKNAMEEKTPGSWDVFTHLDLGDFIGVTGTLFRTKTGEPSIKLEAFTIVAKSLRPPPAKWHGLEDTEIRYRQRYLDLIGNPDVKEVFLKRSAIVHEIRAFFHSRGYVEVETPVMQGIPGGAAAAPFITKHNALGCDFYLRIALELYHKRLLVGGIDKLFEIGKNFRNEGLSRRHNPEFTMLEAYQAFGDYATMMETVENLICDVAKKVRGTLIVNLHRHEKGVLETIKESRRYILVLKQFLTAAQHELGKSAIDFDFLLKELNAAETNFTLDVVWDCARRTVELINNFLSNLRQSEIDLLNKSNNQLNNLKEQKETLEYMISEAREINLKQPWRRVKYNDLVKEKAGADWFAISAAERRQKAHDMGAEIGKEFEDFEVTNAVFSKFIEPTLFQPTFVTHLPKELVPLAKLSPDDPTTVEVFECCISGQEISPGYTEQNDPIAQRTTLEHQAGGEQQKLDEDFLIALEHGMPPAGGIGIGIDRLCMMLLGQESIRDVILFPQLKPK